MCCLLWACAVALNGIFNMQTTCETLVCLSQISFCLFEDLPNCLSVLYPLSSTDFHRRISWKHSRPSWMGPWVARCGGWQPWLRQGSWNWMIFKVSSSLSLSMILWLYDTTPWRIFVFPTSSRWNMMFPLMEPGNLNMHLEAWKYVVGMQRFQPDSNRKSFCSLVSS